MGSIGDCYDNAVIESFWGRMQTELLNRKRWKTRIELANAMFEMSWLRSLNGSGSILSCRKSITRLLMWYSDDSPASGGGSGDRNTQQ